MHPLETLRPQRRCAAALSAHLRKAAAFPPAGKPQHRLNEVFRFFAFLFVAAAVGLWILSARLGDPPAFGEPSEVENLNSPLIAARRISFTPSDVVDDDTPDDAPVPWQGEAELSSLAVSAPPDTCILVKSGESTLYTHRADEELTPASLQKLVTAQATLQASLAYPDAALDENYVYKTIAFAETQPNGGVLNGDLYILGGGDPLLSTPEYATRSELKDAPITQLEELAERIMAAHELSRIEGSVIVVEDRYDDQTSVSTWPESWADAGVTGALNSVAVNQGYSFSPDDVDASSLLPDPEAALRTAALFDDMLEARGVVIPFRPEVAPRNRNYTGNVQLAVIESAPLRDYLKFMLSESDNTTAELLLKEIGLHRKQSEGGNASTLDGAIAVQDILSKRFVALDIPPNPEPLAIPPKDGSGLSPENKLSCAQVVAMLELKPYGGPEGELASYLPVAGRSGTLEDGFTDRQIEGRVKAKTGTLPGVYSLAGFAEGADETWFTFAIIMNYDAAPSEEVDEVAEGIFSEMLRVLTTSKGEAP